MKASIKNKKSITLDDLALMTQRGFEAMNERFEQVDQRFAQIDQRFERIDKKFEGVDVRLDRIEHLIGGSHDRRLDKIEDDMRVVKTLFEKNLAIPFPK